MLSVRRWEVYSHLFQHGPLTRNELDRDLAHGRPNPAYSRRLAEMERMGVLARVGVRVCLVSGFNAELWDVTDQLPTKLPVRPATIRRAQVKLLLEDVRAEIEGGRVGPAFAERWGWCLQAVAP